MPIDTVCRIIRASCRTNNPINERIKNQSLGKLLQILPEQQLS